METAHEAISAMRAKIERRMNQLRMACGDKVFSGAEKRNMVVAYEELSRLLPLLDTLPEQPEVGDEYFLQIGKCTHTLRVGSTSDIDRLIRQDKEQPVEGLEEEIGKWMVEDCGPSDFNPYAEHWCADDIQRTARHFAEWGAEHLKK